MIDWLYRNYFITGVMVVYYLLLIGYGTHAVFTDISQITSSVVGAYTVLMGLPATIAGLLKWRFKKDNDVDPSKK